MSNLPQKKRHGFLIFLLVAILIGVVIFVVVKIVQFTGTKQDVGNHELTDGSVQTTTQGNHDGDTKLFHRSARTSDITMDSNLDLASFGGKYVILPQTDIEDLEITINYLDNDRKILDSIVKRLGDVKQGVQVSFSVSLFDLGLSVAWNTKYETYAVTGGTVSYFS